MQIISEGIKKENKLLKKSLSKKGSIAQRVFCKFIDPVSFLNLSNSNISVHQVRVNIREIENDTHFEIP